MKNIIMIFTLLICVAFSKTSIAQSSVGNTNAKATTIIVEGKKFPMTEQEYNAQKNIEIAKKTNSVPSQNSATTKPSWYIPATNLTSASTGGTTLLSNTPASTLQMPTAVLEQAKAAGLKPAVTPNQTTSKGKE